MVAPPASLKVMMLSSCKTSHCFLTSADGGGERAAQAGGDEAGVRARAAQRSGQGPHGRAGGRPGAAAQDPRRCARSVFSAPVYTWPCALCHLLANNRHLAGEYDASKLLADHMDGPPSGDFSTIRMSLGSITLVLDVKLCCAGD